MELIGVIGGMSWQSTAEYLRLLNEGVRTRLGGLHSARLRVATVDFAPIARMQADGDWSGAAQVLAQEARSLEAAGARFVLIATNTMHKIYDEVAAAVTIPVLHLGDVTADAAHAAGVTRVGLLATKYTMEQSFYRDRLAMHGIQTLIPDEADRRAVQRIIYDELCVGRVEPSSREQLLEIARSLLAEGAEGIVLGCTELELSISPEALDVPVFPTTTLHCEAALELALEQSPQDPEVHATPPPVADLKAARQRMGPSRPNPVVSGLDQPARLDNARSGLAAAQGGQLVADPHRRCCP
ncbi:aspartate/glutamate racemase [Kibdelosporangium aridum]|uniref:Aspartate/glutamate racemase n=1 Tax=Kibdelosporangium aridum TaxID=2030 RepID=A0A428YBM8_KIBAR|nr:aspartate/glutamate racemase family protein [Kibdelosporangium aridum]RSM64880.1 aspartate/glutamate racemase [Kibdelosporangium aridum]